jgi:hypothetical protein
VRGCCGWSEDGTGSADRCTIAKRSPATSQRNAQRRCVFRTAGRPALEARGGARKRGPGPPAAAVDEPRPHPDPAGQICSAIIRGSTEPAGAAWAGMRQAASRSWRCPAKRARGRPAGGGRCDPGRAPLPEPGQCARGSSGLGVDGPGSADWPPRFSPTIRPLPPRPRKPHPSLAGGHRGSNPSRPR